MIERYHGGFEVLSEINDGGVFAGTEVEARSHGEILHRVESPRHLSDYELNYEIQNAWAVALEVAEGDEEVANAILDPSCPVLEGCAPEDIADQGWELQRKRGEVAARLGYTSVEMLDEHGTTHLCLPGCKIEQMA